MRIRGRANVRKGRVCVRINVLFVCCFARDLCETLEASPLAVVPSCLGAVYSHALGAVGPNGDGLTGEEIAELPVSTLEHLQDFRGRETEAESFWGLG